MKYETTTLPGVLLFTPDIYADARGKFLETHRSVNFSAAARSHKELNFVQGNLSDNIPWALRGIHYQIKNPQGKLVRCVRGAIVDIAVDLRKSSTYFKKFVVVPLDDLDNKALWVPPGFGHAFLALSQGALVQYECTTYYEEANARSVRWDDPEIGINWPLSVYPSLKRMTPVLSPKDRMAPLLADTEVFP